MDKKQLISIVVAVMLLGIYSYGVYSMGLNKGVSTITDEYSIQLSNLEVEYQILEERFPVEVLGAFDDGYSSGIAESNILVESIEAINSYELGYEDGLAQNVIDYNSGWTTGYNTGQDSGYNTGYWAGLQDNDGNLYKTAYDIGYNDSLADIGASYDDLYKSGYFDGYSSGYDDALDSTSLDEDFYPFALGEYTMVFREVSSNFEPFYYRSTSVGLPIYMKVGNETIYETAFNFVGEMNTIVIVDLYNPDGDLIAVGGIFGTNLVSPMAPLIKQP